MLWRASMGKGPGRSKSRAGYILGLAAGIGVVIAGSYLSIFVVAQSQGPAGVLASVLSGVVFIRAALLIRRGKARIGGLVLIAFGLTSVIWSLLLSGLVGAIALVGGAPGVMACIGGMLVYR